MTARCSSVMSTSCSGRATVAVRIAHGANPLEPRAVCAECRAAMDRLGIDHRIVEGWVARAVIHTLPAKVIDLELAA